MNGASLASASGNCPSCWNHECRTLRHKKSIAIKSYSACGQMQRCARIPFTPVGDVLFGNEFLECAHISRILLPSKYRQRFFASPPSSIDGVDNAKAEDFFLASRKCRRDPLLGHQRHRFVILRASVCFILPRISSQPPRHARASNE